jgi:N-acyl-D-aspartate/D-glutamate deacylase
MAESLDRRDFLRTAGAALAWPAFAPSTRPASYSTPISGRAELLLRNGVVYDGSGAPPVNVDVLVSGNRILRVGPGLGAANAEVIDLRGLALAPGFIDIHAHTDTVLFAHPGAASKIRQGVTTEVSGQDGSSVAPSSTERADRLKREYAAVGLDVDVTTFAGFFRALDAHRPALNLASMIGAGTVRGLIIGEEDLPATDEELARMVALVRRAVADGVCGLSSGLEYVPGGFASPQELAILDSPLRESGLPNASNMRNEYDRLLAAIE